MSGKAATKDVPSVPQRQAFKHQPDQTGTIFKDEKSLTDFLSTHDASQIPSTAKGMPENSESNEGRPCDGIIKMNLTPEESLTLSNKYAEKEAQGKSYNGESNNCSHHM